MTNYALLALTNNGIALARSINQRWEHPDLPIFVPAKKVEGELRPYPNGGFGPGFQQLFSEYDALICIMATGIVVRNLAPVLVDKRTDPAVLVMDECGHNVISLLSGHLGGANQLTKEVAALLSSNPVITTATDVQNVAAIDMLAKELNAWYDDFKDTTKYINGLLADHQKVGLIQGDPPVRDLRGITEVSYGDSFDPYAAILIVSDCNELLISKKFIQIVPRTRVLGIGAKKNAPFEVIKEEFLYFCQQEMVHHRSVAKIVSIDLKKDEPGIIALAQWLKVPFETYPAEELAKVADKYPQSEFVKKTTGVGAVSQAAADLASNGNVTSARYAHRGVTFALGRPEK